MKHTTRQDLSGWFDAGKLDDATHMIVVCDTFSWEDYPVYVKKGEDVHAKAVECNRRGMQKIVEIYKLSMDKNRQLRETRAFNY